MSFGAAEPRPGAGGVTAGLAAVRGPKAPRGGSAQPLVREVRVRVSGRASGRLPWSGRVALGRAAKCCQAPRSKIGQVRAGVTL